MKDRLERETNDYYDQIARSESREPTEQEIEVQMRQLLKRLNDVGDDETIDAILRAKNCWAGVVEMAQKCQKFGENYNDLCQRLNCNPFHSHLALAAMAFYEMVEMFFRNSMYETAVEMAQNEIDKNECE